MHVFRLGKFYYVKRIPGCIMFGIQLSISLSSTGTYNHNIAYAQESAAETHISVCETPTNNNHNFNPSHMKVSLDNWSDVVSVNYARDPSRVSSMGFLPVS